MKNFVFKAKDITIISQKTVSQWRWNEVKKENPEKLYGISPIKNPVSVEMRGWYWGAIVPTCKSVVKEWKTLTDDDVHEIMKKMFEYFDAYNPLTKRVERYGRTVMSDDSNTERAMNYIAKVRQYFLENYKIDLPDPEEYTHKRDTEGAIPK